MPEVQGKARPRPDVPKNEAFFQRIEIIDINFCIFSITPEKKCIFLFFAY